MWSPQMGQDHRDSVSSITEEKAESAHLISCYQVASNGLARTSKSEKINHHVGSRATMKALFIRTRSKPRIKTQRAAYRVPLVLLAVCLVLMMAATAGARPVISAWPASGAHTGSVAAGLAGCYATGNAHQTHVEIRDINTNLQRTITREEMTGLVPGLGLSGGQEDISGLAFSDSCRFLFILLHNPFSQASVTGRDAILRYDRWDDKLSVFARLALSHGGAHGPQSTAVHHAGRLYVSTSVAGLAVYQARANDAVGTLISQQDLSNGQDIRGLAVDRGSRPTSLYAATSTALFRAELGASTLDFTKMGSFDALDIQSITYARHYGAPGQEGLYLVASPHVWHIPAAQAHGRDPMTPSPYVTGLNPRRIAATPDGALLLATSEGAVMLHDDSDPRLSFRDFVVDEFQQGVRFAKSLISPDGEPPGWVIDANVPWGQPRFHPASPDAAAWTVLILLLSDRLEHDLDAQPLVRSILVRYAGMADDGIVPERSKDGIYRHWYEPHSGTVKIGWDAEWAILSTTKIVLAATRAQHYYANDATIYEAARRIVSRVQNWDTYLSPAPTCHVYLKALEGGGPDLNSPSSAFNEASLFVEQARYFSGSPKATACFDAWLNPSIWPAAEIIDGQPLTGDVPDVFLPAFPYLYAFLLQPDFRSHPAWQEQIKRLRVASAAWTDDHGPQFATVFSAGTTKLAWAPSGYHIDTLGDHPGQVAHFPALLGLAVQGDTGAAVAAYQAYRNGARQAFQPGAGNAPELLYRRSNADPTYTPNSAGLPDVIYGTLGLAALLDPQAIDDLLAISYTAVSTLKALPSPTIPLVSMKRDS